MIHTTAKTLKRTAAKAKRDGTTPSLPRYQAKIHVILVVALFFFFSITWFLNPKSSYDNSRDGNITRLRTRGFLHRVVLSECSNSGPGSGIGVL